jgi:hypothetical protein
MRGPTDQRDLMSSARQHGAEKTTNGARAYNGNMLKGGCAHKGSFGAQSIGGVLSRLVS